MHPLKVLPRLSAFLLNAAICFYAVGQAQAEPVSARIALTKLEQQLQVGDVVFIRIPHVPFTKVADATSSWTNHVGVVAEVSAQTVMVAESRVPVSGMTRLADFVARSEQGRVAVMRLNTPLNTQQQAALKAAVAARNGILYDTGFDLNSKRQFCSRYVREVMQEATGVALGEVEDFATLLKKNPQADQWFWRVWFFGSIPWQRLTVTPASLLNDDRMHAIYDGKVIRLSDIDSLEEGVAK